MWGRGWSERREEMIGRQVNEILPKVLHADMDCSVKHSDWFPLLVDPAASRVSGDGGSDGMKAVKLLLSVTYRGSTTDL